MNARGLSVTVIIINLLSYPCTLRNYYTDQHIDLDHLLIKLGDQFKLQWYLYGLAIGVSQEFLNQLKDYSNSEKDCLTEVLDYWLHHHPDKPSWQEVFEAQKKLEFFNLANESLKNE